MESQQNEKIIIDEIPFQPSTIETIDFAFFDWITSLNLHCNTNKGWNKVDVNWVSSERVYQIKQNRESREINGAIRLPIITLQRTSITKGRKGTAYGNVPHQDDRKGGAASIIISRKINQDKTSNFVNSESKKKIGQINFPKKFPKIIYNTYSIPMPVYIDVTYKIKIKTQFQTQMNELLQPFITKTGSINYFIIKRDGHRFESFIQQDFVQNDNIHEMSEEEKKHETIIEVKTLGYLIGLGENQEQPKIVVRENAASLKIPRERIIFGDIPTHQSINNQDYIGIEKIKK